MELKGSLIRIQGFAVLKRLKQYCQNNDPEICQNTNPWIDKYNLDGSYTCIAQDPCP